MLKQVPYMCMPVYLVHCTAMKNLNVPLIVHAAYDRIFLSLVMSSCTLYVIIETICDDLV